MKNQPKMGQNGDKKRVRGYGRGILEQGKQGRGLLPMNMKKIFEFQVREL